MGRPRALPQIAAASLGGSRAAERPLR